MRTPVFELHILPMIRATDREHMVQYTGIDLWNYEQLVQHAADVETRLGVSKDMPPDETGGPWPDEWVELFRRWRATNFKRLKLGTAEKYAFSETGTPPRATVQATGTYPAAGYNGWLQIEAETHAEKIYVLYFEAPDTPVGGTAEPFDFVAEYDIIAGQPERRKIFIRDKEGLQQIHPLPLP
jgi:hypothetical protein